MACMRIVLAFAAVALLASAATAAQSGVVILKGEAVPAPGPGSPGGVIWLQGGEGGPIQFRIGPDATAAAMPPAPPGGVWTWADAGMPPSALRMAAKEKVTFLGVATTPVMEVLGEQLKLPRGTGLVVDFVGSDSPAAKAGVRQHDILLRLDDQILVNPPQLAVLVRLHKPGDKVKLTLLREGKEEKVTAELGESEQPPLPPHGMLPFGYGTFGHGPKTLDNLVGRLDVLPPGFPPAAATSVFSDGEHTLTVTSRNGEEYLVAKGKDGKVIFEGPVQTDEQRKKVPPDILRKLGKLEQTTRTETSGELSVDDGVHNLTVTASDGRKHLVAKESRTGKVLFDGPIDTEEQLKAVPKEIREKLKGMNAIMIIGSGAGETPL